MCHGVLTQWLWVTLRRFSCDPTSLSFPFQISCTSDKWQSDLFVLLIDTVLHTGMKVAWPLTAWSSNKWWLSQSLWFIDRCVLYRWWWCVDLVFAVRWWAVEICTWLLLTTLKLVARSPPNSRETIKEPKNI